MLLEDFVVLEIRRRALTGEVLLESGPVQKPLLHQRPIQQQLTHERQVGVEHVTKMVIGAAFRNASNSFGTSNFST